MWAHITSAGLLDIIDCSKYLFDVIKGVLYIKEAILFIRVLLYVIEAYGLLNVKDAYLMSYRLIWCHRLFVINTYFLYFL